MSRTPNTTRNYRQLTPAQRTAALEKLRSGGTVKSVAEALNLPRSAVAKLKERKVSERTESTTNTSPVSARLGPTEMEELQKFKVRGNYRSNSDALRALVRASAGMLEFQNETAQEIEGIKSELHRIGVNVNQIALAANKGRIHIVQDRWQDLRLLQRTLPEVRKYLLAVVGEQRRRSVSLFEKYREANNV